jgi:hypothetical protein
LLHAAVLVAVLGCRAIQAQGPAGGQGAQFANVQVLQGLSQAELNATMESFNTALGVECTHCHVIGRGGGLSSAALDEKPAKETARRMIRMVMSLRQQGFPVECATCHAGHVRPLGITAIKDGDALRDMVLADEAERDRERRASAPNATAAPPSAVAAVSNALPSTDAIFAAYENAVGGRAAIAALMSLRATGTIARENGQNSHVEMLQKAPDKTVTVQPAPGGTLARVVVNGKQGWRGNNANPGPISADHWPSIELEARFFRDLKLVDQYSSAVLLPDFRRWNGHDVYVVQGAVKDSTAYDVLYFDVQTGLLLRRDAFQPVILSPVVIQTEYSDYRSVGALKLPFSITRTSYTAGVSRATITWDTIELNPAIDDAAFDRPTTAAASRPQ